MLSVIVALNFALLPPRQQACFLYPWLDRGKIAYHCDFLGQRINLT